jgi:hypothetical protein
MREVRLLYVTVRGVSAERVENKTSTHNGGRYKEVILFHAEFPNMLSGIVRELYIISAHNETSINTLPV